MSSSRGVEAGNSDFSLGDRGWLPSSDSPSFVKLTPLWGQMTAPDGPCSRSLDFPVHASCWECACRRPVLHARVSALRGGGLLLSSPLGLQGRLLVDMAMDFCADSSCYHVLAYSYG